MNQLIDKFRLLAIERWDNLKGGKNVRKANRCFDKMDRLYEEIKKQNKLDSLATLLKDPDDAVVSDVAGFFLKDKSHINESAEQLRRIALKNNSPELSFNAEMCLKELL